MIVNSEQGIEYSVYEGRLNSREAFVCDSLSLVKLSRFAFICHDSSSSGNIYYKGMVGLP
jgi:hypothetical protein